MNKRDRKRFELLARERNALARALQAPVLVDLVGVSPWDVRYFGYQVVSAHFLNRPYRDTEAIAENTATIAVSRNDVRAILARHTVRAIRTT